MPVLRGGYRNGSTRLADEEITLAATFGKAGYDTAAFVGNVTLQRRVGLDNGFDHYDDELSGSETNRADVFERRAEETTERALAWLSAPRGRPFLLWVHYNDPHGHATTPDLSRVPFLLRALGYLAPAPGPAPDD